MRPGDADLRRRCGGWSGGLVSGQWCYPVKPAWARLSALRVEDKLRQPRQQAPLRAARDAPTLRVVVTEQVGPGVRLASPDPAAQMRARLAAAQQECWLPRGPIACIPKAHLRHILHMRLSHRVPATATPAGVISHRAPTHRQSVILRRARLSHAAARRCSPPAQASASARLLHS